MSERADAPFTIEPGGRPLFHRNTFTGIGPEAFLALDLEVRQALAQHNWFLGSHAPRPPAPAARGTRPRQGR
jgi:hypothetical protein